MTALDRLLVIVTVLALLAVGGWFEVEHYGATRYAAGYASAVAAGKAERDKQADINHKTESDLRQTLAERDATAYRREQEYAANLTDAQRRVRTGTDRLRCPASTLQPAAAPSSGPAAATAATDGQGQDLVPETASDILGYGAAIASLVSRYDEVVERFDACRAVNAR